MHELSRTPTIPDRAGQSGQLVFAMGIQHATAWPATQGAGEGDVAKSYWLAHIVTALDKDHGYLGGSMGTMQDTIDALREGEEE